MANYRTQQFNRWWVRSISSARTTLLLFAASFAALFLLLAGLAEHQHYLRDLILLALVALTPCAALYAQRFSAGDL